MSQKFQAYWLTWAAYSFQAPETTNLSPKSVVSTGIRVGLALSQEVIDWETIPSP